MNQRVDADNNGPLTSQEGGEALGKLYMGTCANNVAEFLTMMARKMKDTDSEEEIKRGVQRSKPSLILGKWVWY